MMSHGQNTWKVMRRMTKVKQEPIIANTLSLTEVKKKKRWQYLGPVPITLRLAFRR
uniref:Uncharacterized protein n=1 Tax=Anguilla anguilla TaxID=7936 RepID=A0A0E9WSU5_ANGAN